MTGEDFDPGLHDAGGSFVRLRPARGFTPADVIALTGMTVSVAGRVWVLRDSWGAPG